MGLPECGIADETFDAVAFDPPYVSVGGRSTSGINGMHAAYGMDGAPLTPQGVQDDINAGPGGVLPRRQEGRHRPGEVSKLRYERQAVARTVPTPGRATLSASSSLTT